MYRTLSYCFRDAFQIIVIFFRVALIDDDRLVPILVAPGDHIFSHGITRVYGA